MSEPAENIVGHLTPIFTIGYGKREVEELLSVLQANQIQYQLDVRCKPYSSYKLEFSKNTLQTYLDANGIRYLFIGDALAGLRGRLPGAVTLAVTATATRRVRQDIKNSLGIRNANEFISSFNRENLVLTIADKIAGMVQTRSFLDAHKDQAGIIYCSPRDQVDSLAVQLEAEGYPVLPYHAGMDDVTRRAHQRRSRYEDGLIMVATIAFGMGIKKSNLRFILHYNLPKNIESCYQQIGNSGRDGLPANCLLLYSYGDVGTICYFINQEAPELRRGAEMRLTALPRFLDTQACRRVPLPDYFWERYPQEDCGASNNCLATRPEERGNLRLLPPCVARKDGLLMDIPVSTFLEFVSLIRDLTIACFQLMSLPKVRSKARETRVSRVNITITAPLETRRNSVASLATMIFNQSSAITRFRASFLAYLGVTVGTGGTLAGLLDLVEKRQFRSDEPIIFLHTGGLPALFAFENTNLLVD